MNDVGRPLHRTEIVARALAAHVASATENTAWFRVDDATALLVAVRISAGAGFSLDVFLETTDDTAAGQVYRVGAVGGSPFTTTGNKTVASFDGGVLKRFARLSGVEGLGAGVTWSADFTKVAA